MYQSPFRFLDAAALPQEGEALRRALMLEKKKLLAEFELAGTSTIILDNVELHRQDVLRIFDELGNEARLHYHRAIAADAPLLAFLEHARLEKGARWAVNTLYEDEGFLHFVSPYYAEATNALLQGIITGRAHIDELDAFSQNRALREPADTEAAFRYATRFFTEKKNELLALRQRIDAGGPVKTEEIAAWCSDAGVQVLNRLPDSFAALRYVLANTLNNICVAYDRLKQPQLSLAAIEAAAKIRVDDEELKKLIPANLSIIRRKAARGWWTIDPNTGKRKPKLSLIIALVIILIRIGTGVNSCHQGDVKPYTNIYNLPTTASLDEPPSAASKNFTALLKALARPASLTDADTFFSVNDAVVLSHPHIAGDDVFKPLFGTDTMQPASVVGVTAGESSAVLLRNRSGWEVVALYAVNGRMLGTAYVPPHSNYTISYFLPGIAVGIYAGRNWDDSLVQSYSRYFSSYYSRRQVFRGGFRERAAMLQEDTGGTALIERGKLTSGAKRDTITVSSDAQPGTIGVGLNVGAE